ncbi:MAG TPA: EamA family transporter, partial [Candidatus Cryptobacteroides merdipullorum]|nr:EamA family transporter [Candidatus Cryptobacteroides merdipullorum]
SNITLVLAVQNIGGTLTSVLGALEPLTAVCIGALVFGEDFTLREGFGILLVLSAVTVIILSGTIQRTLGKVFRKTRPRHS